MSSDRIRDVFPADDPEARFVVAMSMARNDVKYCVQQAVRAGANADPEFWYLVRVSYGHPIEGLEARTVAAAQLGRPGLPAATTPGHRQQVRPDSATWRGHDPAPLKARAPCLN